MTADGIATGLMVHSLSEIKNFCDTHTISAFVMFENDEGKVDWWASESFGGQVLLESSVSADQPKQKAAESNPMYLVLGTVIVFGLAISGMAIGVIMSNRQLKGSCGGLSSMTGNENVDASPCSLCTKPASECSKRSGAETPEEAAAE